MIKDFVESWTQETYRQGSAYYQLVKAETIQPGKQVCIVEKATGKVFSGPEARHILNLPKFEVRVNAVDHPKFDIYIQSTSVNRKLPSGTNILVLK